MGTAIVEGATGKCTVKVSVENESWYNKYVISVYSSELVNMQKAELVCENALWSDGGPWHLDAVYRYTCNKMEERKPGGDCSGYDGYPGNGMCCSEACTYFGGGVCSSGYSDDASN